MLERLFVYKSPCLLIYVCGKTSVRQKDLEAKIPAAKILVRPQRPPKNDPQNEIFFFLTY